MAEGALVVVARGIIQKAENLVGQEIGLLWSVQDEIGKLKDTVSTISAVLLDAEEKQQNNQVKEWLKRLKDAIYDADNLVDDISTEALRREVMTQNKKAKEVRIFFSKSNQLGYGFKMGHKVKDMRERLDVIARDRGFHLDERPVETHVVRNRARETHSFVDAENVIGRENDKKAIVGILLDSNVEENVAILPIVGIGGLGKTTLAQYVFNDEEISKHFKKKFWVCVSDNFEVKIIVEKILECAKNQKPDGLEMNTLVSQLKEEIDEKRYLLVLDDVWNEVHEKWSSLQRILTSGKRGSRILVTTRSNKVAKITQTVPVPYMLKGLDEEESWSLFKQMAFEKGQEPEDSIFDAIGKEILKKCRGVPLAIRTIGSLLYFKNTEKEWLSFKDSELSKVPQDENDILPTLKLSYDHLPSHLKQCFAYCCLFPKDYKIHKLTLIKMWMAQGFIRPLGQNQCLEDVGHEYFKDLFWRSFFQEVEKDVCGDIVRFKIHDLMHDLAKLVAGSNIITFDSKEEIFDEKTLHVSFGGHSSQISSSLFGGQSSSQIPSSLFKASKIRTFMLQGRVKDLDKSIYSTIVASFKFIRLLDLHDMRIGTVPSSIGKLKHLRYLDLSNNYIKMLPNSITRLHNLQTLRLNGCPLINLPSDMTKLVNLKYLEIDALYLTHIPRGMGEFINLQTSEFVISMNSHSVFKRNGGLKELHRLNELRGVLKISNLRHEKYAVLQSKDAILKEKQHLQRLVLSWEWRSKVNELNAGYDEMSLEALQPHPNLQELNLSNYGGVRFPSGFALLKNLVRFFLINCNKCQHLPPLDQFHSLRLLYLNKLDSLDYISERDNSDEISDSSFLPSLEELTISHCPNLKGWWRQQSDSVEEVDNDDPVENHLLPSFRHLYTLELEYCPKLTSMPLFPHLVELRLDRCSLKPLELTWRMKMITTTTSTFSSTIVSSSFIPLSKLESMIMENIEEPLPKELSCKLISLEFLTMHRGPLPQGMRHLTMLSDMRIGGSTEVVDLSNDGDEMEWRGLQSLCSLELSSFPKLASLPVGLQHVTSLQKLRIWHCPSLTAIEEWICNLISLQSLHIWNCFKLTSLPEGMRDLTTLQTLEIIGCPILVERCKRETGKDWRKIAHIPNLIGI